MSVEVHVMVILMCAVVSALPLEEGEVNKCTLCPAGKYMSACNTCSECPEDSFTNRDNREDSCHSCFNDCRADLHLQVVMNCTKASDVVCRCISGFVCRRKNKFSDQCTRCEPEQHSTTTTNSTTHPPSTTPAAQDAHTADMAELWVLVVVMLGTTLIVIIILVFCRHRKKECLKKLVKRCSLAKQKEDHNTTPSGSNKIIKETHAQEMNLHPLNSIRSDCLSHQPSSTEQPTPPAGNLGPLHIYGAGTVFVSLLNQFGQNGGERDVEDAGQQDLDMSKMYCPASPPLPLSKEERSRDGSCVSFPSQEQGKECHVSKEEGL